MSFQTGTVVITASCKSHMDSLGIAPLSYLVRHLNRDWGNLGPSDKLENDRALEQGGRILSKYILPDRQSIYLITEADRSHTTIMLTTDY